LGALRDRTPDDLLPQEKDCYLVNSSDIQPLILPVEMLQQRQRARSNRQQSWMLALGCGSSVILHLGLIAGVSYWWRSPAAVDEPVEITLVEPIAVATAPPLVKPPKISIANPPAQVTPKPTVLKPVSTPIAVTSAPKSVAIGVKPIESTAQPQPKSSSIPTKVKPNPIKIQTAKINRPVNTKPIIKPFPIAPKTATSTPVQIPLIDNQIATPSNPKSIQNRAKIKTTLNSPFTSSTPQPPQNTPVPRSWDRSISKTPRSPSISPPIPVQPNDRAAAILNPPAKSPDAPITPATTPDLSSPMSPPSQTRSTTISQPPRGGNTSGNDDKSISRRDRTAGVGLAGGGSQSSSPQAGSNSLPSGDNSNSRSQGDGSSAPGGNFSSSTDRTGGGSGNAGSAGSSGGGGLQCIERCQIPKLRDLQDRDGGKDRLRIRIVIDPNGSVLEATIAKSSDNPQIDAIVLAGIKQMQFKPPGKIIKGIIKANILL
jgi:TonB family protein